MTFISDDVLYEFKEFCSESSTYELEELYTQYMLWKDYFTNIRDRVVEEHGEDTAININILLDIIQLIYEHDNRCGWAAKTCEYSYINHDNRCGWTAKICEYSYINHDLEDIRMDMIETCVHFCLGVYAFGNGLYKLYDAYYSRNNYPEEEQKFIMKELIPYIQIIDRFINMNQTDEFFRRIRGIKNSIKHNINNRKVS